MVGIILNINTGTYEDILFTMPGVVQRKFSKYVSAIE